MFMSLRFKDRILSLAMIAGVSMSFIGVSFAATRGLLPAPHGYGYGYGRGYGYGYGTVCDNMVVHFNNPVWEGRGVLQQKVTLSWAYIVQKGCRIPTTDHVGLYVVSHNQPNRMVSYSIHDNFITIPRTDIEATRNEGMYDIQIYGRTTENDYFNEAADNLVMPALSRP